MHGEVHGRGGVDGRHPDQAAPADVVASAVVHDVHGSPVSSLPTASKSHGKLSPLVDEVHDVSSCHLQIKGIFRGFTDDQLVVHVTHM